MFEGTGVPVAPQSIHHRPFTDHRGQLVDHELPLAVGGDSVGEVGAEVVRMQAHGLMPVAARQGLVAAERTGMRVALPGKELLHHLAGRILRHAFIHPGVLAFVAGQHPVVPAMHAFVHAHAHQASQPPAAGDQREHGVFHAAVTALHEAELGPGIASEVRAHVLEAPHHVGGQLGPGLVRGPVGLVEEMQQRTIRNLCRGMHIVGVGRPGEIVHILGQEMPGPTFPGLFLQGLSSGIVATADGDRVLQHAGCRHRETAVQGDPHVVIAPFPIELAGHVRIGVPATVIVCGHLGIPLGHAVGDAVGIVAPGAPDLDGDLSFEFELEGAGPTRQDGLLQPDPQHGPQVFQGLLPSLSGEPGDLQFPLLLRLQFGDAPTDAFIGVGDGAGSYIHLTARPEGIEVEMEVQLPKGIGTVVRVTEFLLAGEPVRKDIKFNVHAAPDALLPTVALGGEGKCRRQGGSDEGGLDGHGRKDAAQGHGQESRCCRRANSSCWLA